MASHMITIGGKKDDADLGFSVLLAGTDVPGLPETTDRMVEIPGRHGAYDFPADLKSGRFVFHCQLINAVTQEQIQAALRVINEHLLDGWGRPKLLEMKFVWEADKSYFVRYGGRQVVEVDPGKRRKFTLPLIAPDPHAFGVEVNVERQIIASPQIEIYTVSSGLNTPLTMVMDNEGGAINGFSFRTFEVILEWSV